MAEPGAAGMSAPTIAVLPFDNPSGDPEQEYFARGFVEDVVTELSRFPTLEVIHPRTAFTLPREPRSTDGLPEVLRDGYLLYGTVRRMGNVVRVAAQLADAATGRQVWAERFDAPAEGLLSLQDQIVARVASTLASRIDSARLQQARRKPLTSLEVYDCWLRGLDCLHRGTGEDDERARAFFERALELDAHYARAYAGLSLSHFNEWSCQAWELWDEKERLAFDYARRAAELDDRDALVQLALGRILAYRRQFEEAARHVDRAIELNPNGADVLAHAALCRAYLGDHERAAGLASKAIRLNPAHPDWYLTCAAFPLFFLRRYAESTALISRVPRAFVDLPALARGGARPHRRFRARRVLPGDVPVGFRGEDHVRPAAGAGRATPMAAARESLSPAAGRRSPHPWATARGSADGSGRGVLARRRAAGEGPARERGLPARRRLLDVAFEGLVAQLTEVKGFHDLVTLLAQPHKEIHCLELAGRTAEPRRDAPLLEHGVQTGTYCAYSPERPVDWGV